MYQNNDVNYKYCSQATFCALDKAIFKDVDIQNTAATVFFNDLHPRTPHEDMLCASSNGLLKHANEAILFQPPLDGELSASAPTEPPTKYIVYYSSVNHR